MVVRGGTVGAVCLAAAAVALLLLAQDTERTSSTEGGGDVELKQGGSHVAMGSYGGQHHGLWPTMGNSNCGREGGNAWVYSDIYGCGIRPEVSVWCDCDSPQECKEKCGVPKAPEPMPEPEPEPPRARAPTPPPVRAPAPPARPPPPPPPPPPPKAQPAAPRAAPPPPPAPAPPPPPPPPAPEPEPEEEEEEEYEPEPRHGGGGAGYIIEPPYEGYAPKLPVPGRGLPWGGVPPSYPVQPPPAPGPAPVMAPVAAPAPAPTTYMAAAPAQIQVPAQAYYGSYGSYYGSYPVAPLQASTANPFVPQSWSSEDAAEHALNLAEYRVRILKSKVSQAKLRKQLLELSTLPETRSNAALEGVGATALAPTMMSAAPTESSATAAQLKGMKHDLVSVAKKTAAALSELKDSISALKQRQDETDPGMLAEAASGFRGTPQMLQQRQRPESRGRRPTAAEQERRKEEVEAISRDTHNELERLDEAVGRVAEQRERRLKAQKKALLSSLSSSLKHQVSSLEQTVNSAVASREEAERAAVAKDDLVRQKHARRTEERRELRGSLDKLKRKAERAVARGDESSRDDKVDKIESVKRKADERLDGLLSQVDRAIARKEWKRSMVDDPALNHRD